jgi:hypothetical protein
MAMSNRRNKKKPKTLALCGACGLRYVSNERALHLMSCLEWAHYEDIEAFWPAESKEVAVVPLRAMRVNGQALCTPGPDFELRPSVYASPAVLQLFQENPECDALLIVVPEQCRLQATMDRAGTDTPAEASRTTVTLGPLQSDVHEIKDLKQQALRNHNHQQLRKADKRATAAWLRKGSLEEQLDKAVAVVNAALEYQTSTITLEYPSLVPVYTPAEQLWGMEQGRLLRTYFHTDVVAQASQNILSFFPNMTGISTTVMYEKLTACTAFQAHHEDAGFASVNYMMEGFQCWYLVSFDHVQRLVDEWIAYMERRYSLTSAGWTEKQLKSLSLLFLAKQTMMPREVLCRVPHTRVIQRPHTVMLIRGDCIHFGFSFGGPNRAYSINMLCPLLYARDARALRRTMEQIATHWSTYRTIPAARHLDLRGAFLPNIQEGIKESMLWNANEILGAALNMAAIRQPGSDLLRALVEDWKVGSLWRTEMAKLLD